MEAKIGWAIVGASTIAREWMIDAIRQQPDGEVVAVVSGDAGRAARFAAEQGVPKHGADLQTILADPDIRAVYISSTNEQHLSQAVAAARAGKHVLCEKPLALNLADAQAMITACSDAGVVLGTNHHLRNAGTHRKIRELIQSGAIGKPLFARVFHAVSLPPHLRGWRVERADAGGGVVLDISVHDVDVLRFALGAEPVEVSAMTATGNIGRAGLSDGVMAVIRFDNGVLAQIHDAFTVPYAGTGFEVHGTEGSIIARDVMTQQPSGDVVLRSARGHEVVSVEHNNLYATAVAQFHRAIRFGESPAVSGNDGYRSLATALAITESAETGRRIELSFQAK
jgi:1,5-anhydro-D-fructose reductase (1,5-anhydro-D-mannitol-forming)